MVTTVIVIGQGQIGKPLAEFIEASGTCKVYKKDVEPLTINEKENVDVMHVCIPLIDAFVDVVTGYINEYHPGLTIIHSTVAPGITDAIAQKSGSLIVHSPIRGEHKRLKESHLQRFVKFIGPTSAEAGRKAKAHFDALGIPCEVLKDAKTTEVGKLLDTSYYTLNIAFHHEMDRICEYYGVPFDEAVKRFSETFIMDPNYEKPRPVLTPDYIDGHCLIPNVRLLLKDKEWPFLKEILSSNAQRAKECGVKDAITKSD